MLDPQELAAVAKRFGVSDDQVRRDYLLSLLLASLSSTVAGSLVFFGGTALSRTFLPHTRLSEDLDLIAVAPRATVVGEVEQVLARSALRELGRLTWDPPLSARQAQTGGVLRSRDGLTVRVQLLSSADFPSWPTEWRELNQRYSDVSPARLRVFTKPAFVASKTVAWVFRGAPRDLYDLWALAELGAIDAEAGDLYSRLGPTGAPPSAVNFVRAPTDQAWESELAGQTRLSISGHEALAVVRQAWGVA